MIPGKLTLVSREADARGRFLVAGRGTLERLDLATIKRLVAEGHRLEERKTR